MSDVIRIVGWALCAVTLTWSATASAQVPPPPPPIDQPTGDDGAPSTDVDEPTPQGGDAPQAPDVSSSRAKSDEAWAMYQQAFEAAWRGRSVEARETLRLIIARYPGHPAAASARMLLAVRESALDVREREASADEGASGYDAPSKFARAELIAFQTVHGLVAGAELCALVECSQEAAFFVVGAGGLGALGLSLYLTDSRVAPGLSNALDSGVLWGAFHGLMIGGPLLHLDSVAGPALFGQLIGMGLGGLYFYGANPTSGQVSMGNSGGIWAAALATMSLVAISPNNWQDEDYAIAVLAAADIGLIGANALSFVYPMTRARALIVDAGGVLGLVLGGAAAALLVNNPSETQGFTGTTIGALVGLTAAYALTLDFDDDSELPPSALDVSLALSPMGRDGVGASLRLANW